jgi:hypothetical protein
MRCFLYTTNFLIYSHVRYIHSMLVVCLSGNLRTRHKKKLNSVALVCKRTILTERPPHVDEVSANFCGYSMSRGQRNGSPRLLICIFYTRSRYFSIQVAPQLSSRGWVDPVPDTLLLRKCGSAGNGARYLWICSKELRPLDEETSCGMKRAHATQVE